MKNLFVILFIMAVALAGCKSDRPKEAEEQGEKGEVQTIVAVGDSLTAGFGVAEEESYPALLGEKLRAEGHRYRVVNAGVSAETSSGTLSRLEWILTLGPDIVILETGANDGLRGIDPQVAENNIREIMRILAERDVVVLLVGMKMVRNLGPLYVAKFNALYPRLAEESGAVFMPFFLEGVAMQAGLNQADGVHPSALGYKKIVENLYPYVVEAIKKRQNR